MRTMNPDDMAEFYSEVFELAPGNKQAGDPNHYLTDGHVTLVIMPWQIEDYDATGIVTAGMDHIGFKVENIEAVKTESTRSPQQSPPRAVPARDRQGGRGAGESCSRGVAVGQYRFADPDGVLLDIMAD